MTNKKRFVPLHSHSEYSLLDGEAKVTDIIDKAKANGQDAIAITDHGNLFGAARAHIYAQEVGIKHVVGIEFYMTPWGQSMATRGYKKGEKSAYHLVAFAKNKEGYKNLCRLSAVAYSDGFYRKPRIDHETLALYKEGLIVTTACIAGSIPNNVYEGNFYEAEKQFEWFKQQFGDDFYIEIQNHGIEAEDMAFEVLREWGSQWGVKTIATTDSHYLDKEDDVPHDILLCIGTGQKVHGDRKFKFNGAGYHYMNEQEVLKRFPYDVDAVYETGRLADKIDQTVMEFGTLSMPHFGVPLGDDYMAWKTKGGHRLWLPNKKST